MLVCDTPLGLKYKATLDTHPTASLGSDHTWHARQMFSTNTDAADSKLRKETIHFKLISQATATSCDDLQQLLYQ